MQQQIKLLSFDLDDTLWPCMPTIMAAEQEHYHWLKENVPVICDRYDIMQLREKRLALMAENPQWAHDLSRARRESLLALSSEFDCGTDWIEEAYQVFYAARQNITLFDDVSGNLDILARRYRLLALSNGNADIHHTGVAHWFEFSLNAAQAGAKKSEPLIYQQALSKAGITAENAVHIGDDPMQDILGAQRAGIYSVWLNREANVWPEQGFQADAEISSLDELPGLLDELQQKAVAD